MQRKYIVDLVTNRPISSQRKMEIVSTMLQEGYTQAAIAKVFDQRAQAINAYVRRFNLTPNRDLADVDVEKLRQRFSIDIEIYK